MSKSWSDGLRAPWTTFEADEDVPGASGALRWRRPDGLTGALVPSKDAPEARSLHVEIDRLAFFFDR